jgi:hypothetical protein
MNVKGGQPQEDQQEGEGKERLLRGEEGVSILHVYL